MRCLVLIALCFVLANASFMNTRRFQKLLNRYQQKGWDQDGRWGQDGRKGQDNSWDLQEGMFGSDDSDDYIDDYVDEIRRERMFERDQCPRDFEDILGLDEDEHGNWDVEDKFRTRKYSDMEDLFPSRRHQDLEDLGEDTDDLSYGRRYFQEETEERSPMLRELKDANIKLTSRLYEETKNEKDDKNTVVSPLSIQLALAALNWGARGNTRRQIGRVIGGNLKTQERKQIFRTLVRHLKGFRNIDYTSGKHSSKINTVTGLFVTKTTRAQQMFIQQVKSTLGATVKHCSFSSQPQQCRQSINQWVSQKTQHKINSIVPQDAITDNTKMVLVNALELKATWGPQMRRLVTKEAKFYPLNTRKTKIVEVMETEGRFKYYEDELVKIVGVPTKQRELTLYTVVPKDKDGLNEVEKLHLQDSVQLKQLLEKTDKHTRRVQVQLPKFQIKHKIDVRRTLSKQGVTDAFDPLTADFSGITGVGSYGQDQIYEQGSRDEITKLHLNKFIHQCTIKITETGITSTSGVQTQEDYEPYGRVGRFSGLEGDRTEGGRWEGSRFEGGRWETEEFGFPDKLSGWSRREVTGENVVKADRAFAFVLKHNPTNQVIMVGRVIDAAQKTINSVPQTINSVDQF